LRRVFPIKKGHGYYVRAELKRALEGVVKG